jgi:hypothetical protein
MGQANPGGIINLVSEQPFFDKAAFVELALP